MGSTVRYCCVSRGEKTLFVYSGGEGEIENLATLCLESTPPYHKWYFETVGKRTFGFLIDDGFVYFTIIDEGLGSAGVLRFLQRVRDEFKKAAKKGLRGSFSSSKSTNVQERLLPVIHHLITSLGHVSQTEVHDPSPSLRDINGHVEAASSTTFPVMAQSSKPGKSTREHVIAMKDVELEEHRTSADTSVKIDSSQQAGTTSPTSSHKDSGSMRIISSTHNNRKKWWRQVRIVLAIDVAVCLVLFGVWLSVCGGLNCLR